MDPEPIRAALSVPLPSELTTAPADIQYMPPGRHTIRARRGGKPVTVTVLVDASTAETLQKFLTSQLAAATEGNEDRPFFDFNHDDREAAAWPVEFFWAGDDPKAGGVRARVEWSEAGRRAVEGRTFRRFSPTFIPDESGRVIGSETNMGGLVNRAAFKRIQPLFAGASDSADSDLRPSTFDLGLRGTSAAYSAAVDTDAPTKAPLSPSLPHSLSGPRSMQTLLSKLHSLGLVEASATEEADLVAQLVRSVTALRTEIADLKSTIATQDKARAESILADAVRAGRLPPKDEATHGFWLDALTRDEARTVKALEALPVNPALVRVTPADDDRKQPRDLMAAQQRKLAEVRAANPDADFDTVFAKAQADAPELFR